MTAGARACRERVDRERAGSRGRRGGSDNKDEGGRGYYCGEHTRTVSQAAVKYADARDWVNRTTIGSEERKDALKELADANADIRALSK